MWKGLFKKDWSTSWFEGVAKRKQLLSKKNIATQLKFAVMHLNKPEDILWAEETKVKMSDHNAQTNTVYQHKQFIPAYSMVVDGSWVRLVLQPQVNELTMRCSVYPSILESNLRPSVQQLKLGPNRVIKQDNDPKHSRESTADWLWLSQSPDFNLLEMLWWD